MLPGHHHWLPFHWRLLKYAQAFSGSSSYSCSVPNSGVFAGLVISSGGRPPP